MDRIRAILLWLIVITAITSSAIVLHQFWAFHTLINELEYSQQRLVKQLERATEFESRVASAGQSLEALDARHQQLRKRIPDFGLTDSFEQQWQEKVAALGFEILASKEAQVSHSLYREIRLSYTLKVKGKEANIDKLLTWLRGIERVVNIDPLNYHSKEKIGLTIKLYSAEGHSDKPLRLPECLGEPGPLYRLYYQPYIDSYRSARNDYEAICQRFTSKRPSLVNRHRYRYLEDENRRLESILAEIERRVHS